MIKSFDLKTPVTAFNYSAGTATVGFDPNFTDCTVKSDVEILPNGLVKIKLFAYNDIDTLYDRIKLTLTPDKAAELVARITDQLTGDNDE